MTTLSALVEDTYGLLYGIAQAERPKEDVAGALAATDTASITMGTDSLWRRDDYAEFPDGELILFAADASGATAIRRGQRGTTAAIQAASQVTYRNPTFPRYEIENLITQVIRNDLWPHVWTWHRDTLSFSAGQYTYDLDQYVHRVVRVSQFDLNSDGRWYPIDDNQWDTERQINTAVSTNLSMLRLRNVFDETATVYYTAKRQPHIDDLANMSDEVAELIPWAAVGKLTVASRSVARRHNPQNDSTAEVEGADFRDYRGFMTEFLRMRDALNRRLLDEVPAAPRFRPRRRRKVW